MGFGRVALSIGLAAAAGLAARDAGACSCLGYSDARDYANEAVVVFEGILDHAVRRELRLENVFRADRVWKGEVAQEISIDTMGGDCNGVFLGDTCGMSLEVGQRYLVFASFQGLCLPTVSLCSGTRLSSDAEEAFTQLGASTPPGDTNVPPPDSCSAPVCPPEPSGSGGTTQIPADAAPPADAPSGSDPALQAASDDEPSGCTCAVPNARRLAGGELLALVIALGALRRFGRAARA